MPVSKAADSVNFKEFVDSSPARCSLVVESRFDRHGAAYRPRHGIDGADYSVNIKEVAPRRRMVGRTLRVDDHDLLLNTVWQLGKPRTA